MGRRAVGIAPLGQAVDQGLGHILQHCIAPCHIPVKRAVAGGHLAFIARGEHQHPELVADGHQDVATDAGLDVLLRYIGGAVFEVRGQHFQVSRMGRLNRHYPQGNAQVVGQGTGVHDAPFAGVAGGHRYPQHILRPQGVHRYTAGNAGIHPPRQANNNLLMPCLAHIVPHPQHQGVVDLAYRVQGRLHTGGDGGALPGAIGGDEDALGGAHMLQEGGIFAGAGVPQALAQHRFHRQVHHQQVLLELLTPCHQVAFHVKDHAGPVKDQFVLPTHGVHIGDEEEVIAGTGGQHLLPEEALPHVVGGAVDVHDDLCPCLPLDGGGAHRIPDVLADIHADGGAVDDEDGALPPGAEVAVLVEDAVVGQVNLVVDPYQAPFGRNARRVVDLVVLQVHKAEDQSDVGAGLGQFLGDL
ncbi:hypothetical protein HRbin23_01606 [bacterium HR23]|nr:hypothetical protein HRbin23_01606 [bacterium HR23]